MTENLKENLKSSKKKWDAIVKKTDKEELFDNLRGFDGLEVVDSCGYCDEFNRSNCPLRKKEVCDCYRNDEYLFWKYVRQMRKILDSDANSKEWKTAKKLAREIRDAIIECNRELLGE